jgi:hypothetical protein
MADEVHDTLSALREAQNVDIYMLVMMIENLVEVNQLAVMHNRDVESSVRAFILRFFIVQNLLSVIRKAKLNEVDVVAFAHCQIYKVILDSSVLVGTDLDYHFRAFVNRAAEVDVGNFKVAVVVGYTEAEVIGAHGQPLNVHENALGTHTEATLAGLDILGVPSEAEVEHEML